MVTHQEVERLLSEPAQAGDLEEYADDLVAVAQQVAADIGELRKRLAESERDLRDLILAAKDAGVTWKQVAAAVGVSVSNVRHLALGSGERAWPSAKSKPKAARAPKPRTYSGPGVPISEAARRLGVSRPTIYARIERGELQTITTDSGVRLVVVEDDDVTPSASGGRG